MAGPLWLIAGPDVTIQALKGDATVSWRNIRLKSVEKRPLRSPGETSASSSPAPIQNRTPVHDDRRGYPVHNPGTDRGQPLPEGG